MNANYFDSLEAELRAAVPRAARGRRRPRIAWLGWRARAGGLAVAGAVAVTVAVVFVFAGVGHRSAPVHPSRPHHFGGPRGEVLYPRWAVPTLGQLLENFAVLRRHQNALDRSWKPHCGCGNAARQLWGLTRFATRVPGGYRIYLDVEQFILGGQLNMAAGSYVMNFTIVDPHGPESGSSFGPNVGYSVRPLSSRGNDAVWVSVVPDGVATVTWTVGCPSPKGIIGCPGVPVRTFTVPVVNNVAARQIPHANNCRLCAMPWGVTWRTADGKLISSFGGYGNLPAPPFVTGWKGNPALHVLLPNGVGSARFGAQWSVAVQTLTQLLGPPAEANAPTRGCGIDHETVWTSPATADPLAIFERGGRFAGYQYGAPIEEIGLVRGPGAVLTTGSGMTLGDMVRVGRRIYGGGFLTKVVGHGSQPGAGRWRVVSSAGTLRGVVLQNFYPSRVVRAQDRVATVGAGDTGCISSGP